MGRKIGSAGEISKHGTSGTRAAEERQGVRVGGGIKGLPSCGSRPPVPYSVNYLYQSLEIHSSKDLRTILSFNPFGRLAVAAANRARSADFLRINVFDVVPVAAPDSGQKEPTRSFHRAKSPPARRIALSLIHI